MIFRTYVRTCLNDIFSKNFIVKAFVNIYYKFFVESSHDVKFSANLPIFKKEEKKSVFFQSVTGDKIDCK